MSSSRGRGRSRAVIKFQEAHSPTGTAKAETESETEAESCYNSENRPTRRTDIKFRESPKPADTVVCIIPRIITRWALHITYTNIILGIA